MRVAFWKEEPHLHHALDTVESLDVIVVPVFTSTGYFTEVVLPREVRSAGEPGTGRPHRLHWCEPVGTHPGMVEIASARVQEMAGDGSEAVVVVGHGTPRHPDSARATRALADSLASLGARGPVECAFLDEAPGVAEVISGLDAGRVVVLPFFISEGWHAGVTLPAGLGVEEGRGIVDGKEVLFAEPVGTHPALEAIVVDRALEAGSRARADRRPRRSGSTPARFAKAAFLERIVRIGGEGWTFLEVHIRPEVGGGSTTFDVRHAADAGKPTDALTLHLDPDAADRIAALTSTGDHRPLRTTPDLVRGWRFGGLGPEAVWAVLSHLYPSAAVHAHLGASRTRGARTFDETAARQSGMFAPLRGASEAVVEEATDACCRSGRCLRTVLWAPSEEGGPPAGPGEEAVVPCFEPCSVLLTRALEAHRPSGSRA